VILTVLAYSFREFLEDFRLINLEALTVLASYFRDSKCFVLLIYRP